MVAIQHLGGVGHVQIVGRQFAPGQVDNPVHVSTNDADFGRHGRHGSQPGQFSFYSGAGFGRQFLLFYRHR